MESATVSGPIAESVMDLSLRASSQSASGNGGVNIVRPVPRPPWSILWYQNLWSLRNNEENCENIAKDESTELHSHRLYRLSMAAFTNNFYGTCNQQNFEPRHSSVENTKDFSILSPTTEEDDNGNENDNDSENSDSVVVTTGPSSNENSIRSSQKPGSDSHSLLGHQTTVVLDIACCDGPVQFKRISNPNFALTVEHNQVPPPEGGTSSMAMFISSKRPTPTPSTSQSPSRKYLQVKQRQIHSTGSQTSINSEFTSTSTQSPSTDSSSPTTLKTYLCIYCNQSFKSLFCYQKHKKRHLNPVSVDITTTIPNVNVIPAIQEPTGVPGTSKRPTSTFTPSRDGRKTTEQIQENPTTSQAKTKDLNVQFFPCKKCGCKFPSYYFVHKHRKICH